MEVKPTAPNAASSPHRDRILLWALALLMLARTGSNLTTADPDLWGHTLYGLDHLQTGQLARCDPYSYTARGAAWINHEWLTELIFAWSWHHFGAAGLWALRIILVGTTLLIVVRLISETTSGLWAGILTLTACWIELNRGSAIRPQLFTMALLAVFLLLIWRIYERPRRPIAAAFIFVPLMALWTNLHGGFMVGLALILALLFHQTFECWRGNVARRRLQVTAIAVGMALLATLANPYGTKLWSFLYVVVSTPAGGRIGEWGSMLSFHPQTLLTGFYVLLALFLFATPAMLRARDWFEWTVLAATGCGALIQTRHGPLFAIIAAAWLPRYLEAALPRLALAPRFGRAFVTAVAALAVVSAVGTHLREGGRPGVVLVPSASHPLDAYRFIRAGGLQGNILVMFDWAQSALWHLHDTCKIAYDGRFNTVYSVRVEDDYFAFHNGGNDWSNLLDRYDTQMVLMPRGWAASERMRQRDDFVIVCEGSPRINATDGSDATPVLYLRRGAFGDFASRSANWPQTLPTPPDFFRFGDPLK